MAKPTQATRHISIETPLGEDVLLLRSFSGHEEVSRIFEFELDLLSEDHQIDFDDIMGQNVTVCMDLPQGGKRFWNGFVNRFVQGVSSSVRFAPYRATMVPWLWFLTRTSDCRIFQEMSVPDIIKKVCNDLGFSDIEDRLSGAYGALTYCVQYRETAFNFISRLMEREGIYYYFRHEQNKNTLVLCDSLSMHDSFEGYEEIDYIPDVHGSANQEKITHWSVEKVVQPGKFAFSDYNYLKPKTSLMSTDEYVKPHAGADYEIYDYPGAYLEKSEGDKYAKVRMEEKARAHEVCTGRSDSRGFCPGHLFKMNKHVREDQNRQYLVLSVDYRLSAKDYETSGGQDELCACTLRAIPGNVQFRPACQTPRPVIQGTQTAVVTGPPGEEIYTDRHGRVKVQFHWDREGQRDENSSCWIRVSQVHAGKSFGAIDIPRIGEEVIVSFIEGDPDRPVITGRVYNAELTPPFALPGKKVVSGMKSNSTPGGGGYNEITMNDTKGQEVMTVHAQKDMNSVVENDRSTTLVEGNDTLAVKAGTRSVTVKGDTSLVVQAGDRTVNVTGDYQLDTTNEIRVKAPTKITLTCGGSSVTIEPDKITLSAGGGSSVTLDKKAFMIGQAEAKVEAPKSTLSGGGSTTKVDAGGVTVSGPKISLNG